jgi:hypothetical protein
MVTSMTDVHKIVVSLSDPDLVIEPGSVAQLTITITNHQETPDRLSLEIEGIDVEWYAVPVPAVNMAPGANAVLKVPFKVARTSANRAGTYPFLVRVQAMETGEVGVAQASLNVKAYNALQVELNPKRAVATFFHPLNDFEVSVGNLGNVEETLDLFASDPEDGCAYEYDTDRITLKPGQTEIVPLAVRPKASSLLGGTRIYGFTASTRSVEDSYIAANAHGQIEKHALISPLVGIFLMLLGLTGGGIFLFRPKPPELIKITKFAAVPKQIEQGQPTTLTWEVSGIAPADRHLVLSHHVGENGAEIVDGELPTEAGKEAVTPEYPTTAYTLTARGARDQKIVKQTTWVKVTPAKAPPKPVIKQFVASPRKIHLGDTVTLSWNAIDQKSFILDPGNVTLSQFEETRQVTPDQDTEYKLRAFNTKGDFVLKKVSVKVAPVNVCIAEIDYLSVKPTPVYVGVPVRLKWSTHFTRSARIDSTDPGITIGDISPGESSQVVTFTSTTPVTFTLTATDSASKTVSKSLTVNPKIKPLPPPPPVDTTPGAAAPGNGVTPSTTGTGVTPGIDGKVNQ